MDSVFEFEDTILTGPFNDTLLNFNDSATLNASSTEDFLSTSSESTTSSSVISSVLSTTLQTIFSEVISNASTTISSLNTSFSFNVTSTNPTSTLPTTTTTPFPYVNLSYATSTREPCPCLNVTTTPVTDNIFNLTNGTNAPTSVSMMASTELVLTVIPLSIISLLIIFGNLLVIVAVFTQRSLRSPQNIFIVSLAVADMAVGVFILPFNITYLVLRRWPFGAFFCKSWLTGDVALCCVSIFHLCAIGVDRYRAITDGINYVQKRNLKSVLWTVSILWILAIWIGSPPILALNNWSIVYDGNVCSMPLDPGYAFHLATGALFFPLLIMSVIYYKIYGAIKERLKERARVTCIELTSDADTTDRLESSEAGSQSADELENGKSINKGGTSKRKQSAQISTFLVNKQKFSLSRERKAARTLGIIMGAFIVCWLPLGFLNTIGAMLPPDHQPSDEAFHALTWLGYVNSALNPIIYAISHQEFQKAFRRVLHLN